jgi:hypothetical protein
MLVLLAGGAWLLAEGAACGGARGAFDGSLYRDGPIAFRVPPAPSSWRRLEVGDAALAFRDEAREASVLVNAHCNERDQDVPLVALTNQLVMGTTERDAQIEETLAMDGREARHTRMNAKLDGVLRSYDIYVLKKDSCVYDFVYVAPPERLAAGVGDFEQFVRGFHTVSEGS